jgi:hypothetical protein
MVVATRDMIPITPRAIPLEIKEEGNHLQFAGPLAFLPLPSFCVYNQFRRWVRFVSTGLLSNDVSENSFLLQTPLLHRFEIRHHYKVNKTSTASHSCFLSWGVLCLTLVLDELLPVFGGEDVLAVMRVVVSGGSSLF